MAEKLRGVPFDANEVILPDGTAGYDNVLYAADFAELVKTYFKNGILVPGGALISSEMRIDEIDTTTIKVNVGNMIVNGRTAFLTEPVSLAVNKGGAGVERFDRVVVELNLNSNEFKLFVLEGVLSASPVPPQLTRTDKIYQMSLAMVKANQAGVYEIVDERPNENLCGISQVLIGVRPPLPVTGDDASNIGYDNSLTKVPITTVQDALDVALSLDKTVTLLTSNWTEGTQTVQLQGVRPDSGLIVDIIAKNIDEANFWGNIWKIETLSNALRFYTSKPINIDLDVKIKVVR